VAGVVLAARRRLHVEDFAHLALAGGTALLLAGPYLVEQGSRIANYRWPTATVASLGASARDWFRLKDSTLGSALPLVGPAAGAQLALYPGTVLLLLAYFGLAGLHRRRLRTVVAIGAMALVASLLADGLGLHLFGVGWYALLRDHVPGFARIRSPYRFAVLTQIGIALLAGFGLDALRRWSRRWGAALAIALCALAIVEVVQVPLATAPAIPGHNADWVAYLSAQPRGPVAMVPFPRGPTSVDYADTTTAMLLGLEHGHPLVNGYSGFFPARAIGLRHV